MVHVDAGCTSAGRTISVGEERAKGLGQDSFKSKRAACCVLNYNFLEQAERSTTGPLTALVSRNMHLEMVERANGPLLKDCSGYKVQKVELRHHTC